jgi:hypothetical protein
MARSCAGCKTKTGKQARELDPERETSEHLRERKPEQMSGWSVVRYGARGQSSWPRALAASGKQNGFTSRFFINSKNLHGKRERICCASRAGNEQIISFGKNEAAAKLKN